MQDWRTIGPVQLWDTISAQGESFASLSTFTTSRLGHVVDRLADGSLLDKLWKNDFPAFYRYLLRDECGLIIPLWKIWETAQHTGALHYRPLSYRWHRPFRFRRGPVPRTRCQRGGHGYFRSVRTYQERCETDFLDSYDEDARDHGVRIRRRRSAKALPEPRDDILRSDWGVRSWKKHRKHQWRD